MASLLGPRHRAAPTSWCSRPVRLIAGLAGALISPMLSVDPYIGNIYLVRSFFVVTVGGLGELLGGTLIGASSSAAPRRSSRWPRARPSPRPSCSRSRSWCCAFGRRACWASDESSTARRRGRRVGRRGAPRRCAGGFWTARALAAVVVFLALAVLPAVISGYPIYILPQYMLFGMLALSLALLWGFIGIVSFGQAAFFALGAYAMGLAMQQTARPSTRPISGCSAASLLGGALAGVDRLLPVQRRRARRLFRHRHAGPLDHRRADRGQPVADHRRLERHVHRPHVADLRPARRGLAVRRTRRSTTSCWSWSRRPSRCSRA